MSSLRAGPRVGRGRRWVVRRARATAVARYPRFGLHRGPTGIVLTNKHVVGASRRLVVQTADGKQFPVTQVKTDQEHDVAC